MARPLFIDTGAWFALNDSRDQYHAVAKQNYQLLWQQYQPWVTTHLVIAETYALIRYRGGYRPAMNFLQTVTSNSQIVRIHVTTTTEKAAIATLQQYSDQDFTLVDAVSFAVMREQGISEAFAFDHHFMIAGFRLVP